MSKPSLPQGMRDFGPEVVRKRNYIFDTIRHVFELYGFQPLETPAMENMETLLGKYGEEGDKLIFKVLNNGLDHPGKEKQAREDFEKILEGKNVKGITERALKYDLTIPFARYVAMNYNQLVFPFKRYQVQPVWRADRPQRGRYREFWQCDADVVGSSSLLNEIEFLHIYATVFEKLGILVEIKINNRRILQALAELCQEPGRMSDITIAIDKLDKIGLDKVREELSQRKFNQDQIALIEKYLLIANHSGDNRLIIQELKKLFSENSSGNQGLNELEHVLDDIGAVGFANKILIDPTLARGLNYYTGMIFEIKAPAEIKIGSLGGGGRYDDLTGLFGVPDIAGVGISFGVDRIYDTMEELNLFPAVLNIGTQVLFFNSGKKEIDSRLFDSMQKLRKENIRCEMYHAEAGINKQFKYADNKKIPYVVFADSNDLEKGTCKVKDIRGEYSSPETVKQEDLSNYAFKF